MRIRISIFFSLMFLSVMGQALATSIPASDDDILPLEERPKQHILGQAIIEPVRKKSAFHLGIGIKYEIAPGPTPRVMHHMEMLYSPTYRKYYLQKLGSSKHNAATVNRIGYVDNTDIIKRWQEMAVKPHQK